MQITAKIPIEIIDVIQGLILLFLAAESVIRHLLRSRTERVTPGELGTVSRTLRGDDGLMDFLFGIPVLGFVFQFLAYLIDAIFTTNLPGPDAPARDADRARSAVRGHERAERHRQHRHRGDDADGARSSGSWRP